MTAAVDFITALRAMDRALVAKAFPPISDDWWRWIETIYRGPMRRQAVIRAGRRAGKTTTLLRVAVCEAIAGDWQVSPGDTAVVAVISAKREQAKERLETIEAILRALGYTKVRGEPVEEMTYSLTASELTILVEQQGRLCPVAFRVQTASLNSVGFTALFILADEVTRWEDSEGNNPTKAVLASLRPSLATIPRARIWVVSSAWSTLDEHYRLIEQGSSAHQWAFGGTGGESWVMNPTLSEADTHELEPDPIAWEREYANRPMRSDPIAYLDGALLDAAIGPAVLRAHTVGGGDFAFSRNASALTIASADGYGESATVSVVHAREWFPRPGAPLRPSVICSAAAIVAREWGADTVATDSHYQETAAEAFEAHRVSRAPVGEPFATVQRARVLLTRGALFIARGDWTDRLVSQLKRIRVEPAPSGRMRVVMPIDVEASGLESHGDLAASALAAIWHATESGDDEYVGGAPFRGRDAAPERPRTGEEFAAWDDDHEAKGRGVWG